jgi:hypothetical protein
MYAGSQFNWYDQSSMTTAAAEVTVASPNVRYLCFITSDKGTEDLTTLSGNSWASMYGSKLSFAKHGQPLIQASRIIDAGGICITKRIVADDAALANVALVATVTSETRNKNDVNGNPLYIDASGNETTDPGTDNTNARATYEVAVISHGLMSLEGAETKEEVIANAKEATFADSGVFPLYVFCDNGRGVSGKNITLNPEYSVSKNGNYMIYSASVMEGTSRSENITFTIDPTIIYDNTSLALSEYSMTQVKCATINENVTAFIAKLAEITGYGEDYLLTQDFLFGKTLKGNDIAGIEFDESSVDITATYGVELQNGSNGSFGDAPFGTDAYTEKLTKYIYGEYSDELFDFTACAADLVFDANYPDAVKTAIGWFVDWRQDMFFFRDLGLDITSYEKLYSKVTTSTVTPSKFNAIYATSYDVYDPLTATPIQVTMMYNMAPLMVAFFAGGRNRPLCGPSNGMSFTDYIAGTVRYTPRITPNTNQKSLLEDLRVNYAAKTDASSDELVIETCYTSQEAYSQASFINNILSIQEVVKAVRAYSPKVRYQFYNGSDFSAYADTITDNVLANYTSRFNTLELVYTQDTVMAAKKIFKAALNVACGTFIQTEIYDVFIINSDETTSA